MTDKRHMRTYHSIRKQHDIKSY